MVSSQTSSFEKHGSTALSESILLFVHIGDLHLTTEATDNYRDLQAIVREITDEIGNALDFVFIPGDNADNGLPAQYALARRALARLPVPVHVITGDHDMEQGSLDNFYTALGATQLPNAIDAGGLRCLFLDMCGPGSGGPDFRIGDRQMAWLEAELRAADASEQRCAIFMHSFPADLRGEGETARINAALQARGVLLVAMGHTHYNELANDGRTIFAATRSTGQIEEGPVGYSVIAIDARTVSWRFRELGSAFPLVLVTAPADRRLATDASDADHLPQGECLVRASVLGRTPIAHCTCRIDDGPEVAMRPTAATRYAVSVVITAATRTLTVTATDDHGAIGTESIAIATRDHLVAPRRGDGSDADTVGAWPERGLLGTQLGPNRNGRKW
ncbi:metallophosphoesterase [Beijerinckia sp. L45]|uniref:metallophosphoesterase family protein n=1 Tax=Beijerinckia sp. L45 TaxID=1641855 RepID=UPI00131C939A|nr:metallophosphoesterase [Beijerinckia sp. L45]